MVVPYTTCSNGQNFNFLHSSQWITFTFLVMAALFALILLHPPYYAIHLFPFKFIFHSFAHYLFFAVKKLALKVDARFCSFFLSFFLSSFFLSFLSKNNLYLAHFKTMVLNLEYQFSVRIPSIIIFSFLSFIHFLFLIAAHSGQELKWNNTDKKKNTTLLGF